ncbi:MAG: carbohydrate-binding domain-containing protein [Acidimicrobiales bacterium]
MTRRITMVTFAALLFAAGAPTQTARAAEPAAPFTVYAFEAETMRRTGLSAITQQAGATKAEAVSLWANGAAYRMSHSPDAERMVLRLRGDQCDGAPTARIDVDGVTVANVTVAATAWTDYTIDLALDHGSHWIAVHFRNDRRSTTCDRNLHIDTISLRSSTPINTGTAGSVCQATDGGFGFTPPPADISTTYLGTGPAYYEVGSPTGPFAGQRPKGIMLLIHGGGWSAVGPGPVAAYRSEADRWRARGWSTVNVSYRGCAASVDDVLWFYDRVEPVAGALPVCAVGRSAGGHLAGMLAALRPSLDCFMAEGAPLDLLTVRTDPAFDRARGAGTQLIGPEWAYQKAVAAFGSDRLAELSPARRTESMHARPLVAAAAHDHLVGTGQTTAFALAYTVTHPLAAPVTPIILEGGTIPWVHAPTTQAAQDRLNAEQERLAQAIAG